MSKHSQVKSTKITKKPIFSDPLILQDGSIVFGCHDGVVRCLNGSNVCETLWQYDALSIIYTKPLYLGDSVIVCTTAGDVIRLKNGEAIRKRKVDGEFFSSAISLPPGKKT